MSQENVLQVTEGNNTFWINKLSKIYHQDPTQTKVQFADIDSAKSFFLTTEALEIYNKYCHDQRWQLANDQQSLHWTASFVINDGSLNDHDHWKNEKQELDPLWFIADNVEIEHDALHLF
jgi:hypothetical protein